MAHCPPNYAPVSTCLFTPDNAGISQCLIILMVLVVSQNTKYYHSLTTTDSLSRTLDTHSPDTLLLRREDVGQPCTARGSSLFQHHGHGAFNL